MIINCKQIPIINNLIEGINNLVGGIKQYKLNPLAKSYRKYGHSKETSRS